MLVGLKIWRYDSKSGDRALKEYEIDAPEEATLLDVLDLIKDRQDGTLAYRKSCRMMICGSCGMRMDGAAVLACKTRMYEIAESGHAPVISAMGNLRSSRTSSSTWSRSGRSSAPSAPGSSGLRPAARRARVRDPAGAHEPHPQGIALHQLRLLRLRVQRDGVRPRVPRAAGACEGNALRRRPARRDRGRAARVVQLAARDLGVHALLLLQRALPQGRRPARRDREARRRVRQARDRPRHGREARQVVRHLGEDDRLAARDGARAEDPGHPRGDQADEVRGRARGAGQGAAAVPAACRAEGGGGARALRHRQDAGTRRRRGHRAGRARAVAPRAQPRGRGARPVRRRLVRAAVHRRRGAAGGDQGMGSLTQADVTPGAEPTRKPEGGA